MRLVVSIAREMKRSKIKSGMRGVRGKHYKWNVQKWLMERWLLRRNLNKGVRFFANILREKLFQAQKIAGPRRGTIFLFSNSKNPGWVELSKQRKNLLLSEVRGCQMPCHVGTLKFKANTLKFSFCHRKCFVFKKII